MGAFADGAATGDKTTGLGAVAELLRRNSIDPAEIGRVQRISAWQSASKDADGEVQITDLVGVQLSPSWEEGPKWPVITPGPLVKLPAMSKSRKPDGDWRTAVILPDIQGGYFRGSDGRLEPTHDEAALDIALAVVKDAKPDLVVLVGDNIDAPEFGKYRLSPAYQQTTQATIDRMTLFLAQLRAASGAGIKIVWLSGNHEERIPNYLLDNAKAAFGLRRGTLPDERPRSWPLLSVPELLRMDEFGVEYKPGYPASHLWVTPKLKIIHGDIVKSQTSTASAYLNREKTSVIFGHIHRREYAARTRDDHDGPREVMAASPGCLARTDGAVPSTKGGTDLDGRPIRRQEDWQSGLCVVPYNVKSGEFVYEQIAVHDSGGNRWAMWRGREYSA